MHFSRHIWISKDILCERSWNCQFVYTPLFLVYMCFKVSVHQNVCVGVEHVCVFVCMCTYLSTPTCPPYFVCPQVLFLPPPLFYPDLTPMCPPCPNPFPGRKVLIEGAGFSLWPVGVHYCVFISKRGLPDWFNIHVSASYSWPRTQRDSSTVKLGLHSK